MSLAQYSSGGTPLSVERLVLGTSDPNHLLVGCSEGSLRLFDLRASRQAALTLHPFGRQPLAGVAYEPNGKPGLLVSGAAGANTAGAWGRAGGLMYSG